MSKSKTTAKETTVTTTYEPGQIVNVPTIREDGLRVRRDALVISAPSAEIRVIEVADSKTTTRVSVEWLDAYAA